MMQVMEIRIVDGGDQLFGLFKIGDRGGVFVHALVRGPCHQQRLGFGFNVGAFNRQRARFKRRAQCRHRCAGDAVPTRDQEQQRQSFRA